MSDCATLQLVSLHGVSRQGPTNCKGVDMDEHSGIYRICLGNGHFYIGSSQDIGVRVGHHLQTLKANTHHNPRAQRCWNKHGVFEAETLELCEIDVLLQREQFYLDMYFIDKNNVNATPTAGSTLGHCHTEASKAKMRAAHKGKQFSTEWCAKIALANKGKKKPPRTAEHCEKIAAALKGKKRKPHSVLTKAKIAAAKLGKKRKPFSVEHRANLGVASTGRKHSVETKEKMSVWQKGKPKQTKQGAISL